MDLRLDQSIAALASPPGRSARGIVRISGDHVRQVMADWFLPDHTTDWDIATTARSHSGTLQLDSDGQPVRISVQVLFWPTGRSYTGQPLIELHLPGSPCLLEAVLGEACRHGARPARPGEFTMRAFLAGKLDLVQAEAVLGVIDAHDHRELQQALSQLAGGVSQQLASLRRDLIELLADLEAGLDFVDEDIEFVSRDEVTRRLEIALEFVGDLSRLTQDRMKARVWPKVALAGLPNAGKSTLFNRLAGSQAALVSDERGTTRDFLIRSVTWDGFSFELVDTAGWENEAIGIAAAAQTHRSEQFEQSDLVLWCSSAGMGSQERNIDERLYQDALRLNPGTIRLWTKSDLSTDSDRELMTECQTEPSANSGARVIFVSAISQQGLEDLQRALHEHFGADRSGSTQWLGATAARCRETLNSVITALKHARQAAGSPGAGDELIAVDLREAVEQLGTILGVIYTDDILDRIFSKFCIGK